MYACGGEYYAQVRDELVALTPLPALEAGSGNGRIVAGVRTAG